LLDDTPPSLSRIEEFLKGEAKHCSSVSVVHSETTSGIINDIESIGELVSQYKKQFIVDSMSAFGAVPVNFQRANIDFLVSSSNKCIEGCPGFSFIIAKKSSLSSCKGNASSLALDIEGQSAGLDSTGQFRFTPPTHSLLAFKQAMDELKLEGGVKARAKRYKTNQTILAKGLKELGFQLYLKPENQGYIISSYHYAKDSNWDFNKFYNELNSQGFVIYPGKVSKTDCFRIGHIGRIFPQDTENLVKTIDKVCQQMKTAKYFPKKHQ
jgi:2-aminoethylphosphonate-pyruvate transaminase